MDQDRRVQVKISPQYIEQMYYDMGGKEETTLSMTWLMN